MAEQIMVKKRGWKIILAIFFLVLIGGIAFGILTYVQYKQLSSFAADKTLEQDLAALSGGDCSKLPIMEKKYAEMEKALKSNCWNPLISLGVRKYASAFSQNLCRDIKNPENQFNTLLQQSKTFCAGLKN